MGEGSVEKGKLASVAFRPVSVRCVDVQAETIAPVGFVPSMRTLGEDLRRRLLRGVFGLELGGDDLELRAELEALDTATAFFVGDELDRVKIDARSEPHGDGVRVIARIAVTA